MSNVAVNPKQQINIKLDLVKGWTNQSSITLKQCDNNSRYLMIRVSNETPMNIQEYTPLLFVKRTDGKIYTTACQIVRGEVGEFLAKLNQEILGVEGQIVLEVALTKDGTEVLSFPHFALQVEGSLHDEVAEETTEEVGILWELIHQTETSLVEMENNFGSFKQEKENEFQVAEAKRQANETVRQQTYTRMENTVNQVYNTTLKYRIID